MTTAIDASDFEHRVRALTGSGHGIRPFVCDGFPWDCEIFLVGHNPKTDTTFWPFWSALSGFDKTGWLNEYKRCHRTYSTTRRRLEIVGDALKPLRVLEANLAPVRSDEFSDLPPDSKRDRDLFDYLLSVVSPRLIVVYGSESRRHLETRLRVSLGASPTTASLSGNEFEVCAIAHLSARKAGWTDAAIRNFAIGLRRLYA